MQLKIFRRSWIGLIVCLSVGIIQLLNHLMAFTHTRTHLKNRNLLSSLDSPESFILSSNLHAFSVGGKDMIGSPGRNKTDFTSNGKSYLSVTLPRPLNESKPMRAPSTYRNYSDTMENKLEWAAHHLNILFPKSKNVTLLKDDYQSNFADASVKYFIYPEHLFLDDQRYYIRNLIGNDLKTNPRITPKQYIEDALWEVQIINSLWNHSLRTDSYEEAELFIIPVPFSTMFFDYINRNNRTRLFEHARLALENSPPFQQGKPHVLVSTTFPLFNRHYAMDKNFKRLYNTVKQVSVARPDDLLASHYAYQNNVTPGEDFRGFDKIMSSYAPETEYQFSIGLGYEALHLPLRVPTWEKFQRSKFYIFYHIRPTDFYCNSTEYRRAPILNVSSSALPVSSLGYNIGKNRWKKEYADSKFCLVVRGDTPHSHALFNAVKVGCIPVVISDWYPFYAPPFPTILDMRDFCIFIGEDEFMKNPERALQSLQHLPREVKESKLASLRWAQQVILMDHPRSLFVPAFVQEAMASFARPASVLLSSKR